MLDECKILVTGSINSFLRGKSYKRCKRMHELLTLSFEILHFESYLKTRNWEEIMGTILQEKNIWKVSNTNTCIARLNNLINLSKTTFCMSLQQ